ncbi:M4 family metallopeptidase [Foetidibacter luteolus]|uniref:M4 family metallopeptidase n=1 Tax=Foetidibacter luteolus TaxID=2608880 RepID=UPI00129AB37E|nr:M4 family metallopeptidase [Foetidibacter luteolus]
MKSFIKYITENIRPPLLLLLILFISGQLVAQQGTPLSDRLKKMAKAGSTREWIDFFEDSTIKATSIFKDYKAAFDLANDDEMVVKKVKKDRLNFSHYRYQQYYKNIPVLYGEYIIHQEPERIVKSGNGRLITGLNLGNTARVSEQQALDAAIAFMGAGKYLWQNPEMEKELKRQQKDPSATYYPKGSLVYAPSSNDSKFKPTDYRLAWFFKIYPDQSQVMAKNVYVDALTGKVIHNVNISMACSAGSGTSAFNGTVNISTEFTGTVYRSHNNCQATDLYVYNCGGGGASNTYYTDLDNVWGATELTRSATQAMWGTEMTYNYFNGQHGRQSWNGSAGDMISYNNANAGSNNACWGCTGNSAIFYAGNTNSSTDDWNTNDIVGHEFAHGVTQDEAGLIYSYESGALNESFSDIFGEMIESWSEGINDYLVGADRGAIRSLSNPNAYGDPDTYLGTNWYIGSGDNGGVHINSGVQNHWFYLLSEGGSGTNDLGQAYNVTAITRFKARLIAYRALTEYLTSTSQYIDARRATLQAAWDLYGQCSQEIISVGDAWHAVGVEAQSPAYTQNACGNYPANGTWVQAISTTYGGNGCATTITPSASVVYFTARDRVRLLPGFTAQSGSNFIAYLEPCSSTRWRTTGEQVIMSDPEKGIKPPVAVNVDNSGELERLAQEPGVEVSPNPFAQSFILTINAKKEGKAQIVLYNSYGARVQRQAGVNLIKGVNRVTVDGSALASGMYMVEVNMGDSKLVKKVIKSR